MFCQFEFATQTEDMETDEVKHEEQKSKPEDEASKADTDKTEEKTEDKIEEKSSKEVCVHDMFSFFHLKSWMGIYSI